MTHLRPGTSPAQPSVRGGGCWPHYGSGVGVPISIIVLELYGIAGETRDRPVPIDKLRLLGENRIGARTIDRVRWTLRYWLHAYRMVPFPIPPTVLAIISHCTRIEADGELERKIGLQSTVHRTNGPAYLTSRSLNLQVQGFTTAGSASSLIQSGLGTVLCQVDPTGR